MMVDIISYLIKPEYLTAFLVFFVPGYLYLLRIRFEHIANIRFPRLLQIDWIFFSVIISVIFSSIYMISFLNFNMWMGALNYGANTNLYQLVPVVIGVIFLQIPLWKIGRRKFIKPIWIAVVYLIMFSLPFFDVSVGLGIPLEYHILGILFLVIFYILYDKMERWLIRNLMPEKH